MSPPAQSSWANWRLKLDAIARSENDGTDAAEAQNLFDKAWAAGTVGYRRPAQTHEEDKSIYLKLTMLIKQIIESKERDNLLNQIFTTPRNTGVLLLGFCSLVQWRYESYILKLLQILHQLKCGGVELAVVTARATVPGSRRRRTQTNHANSSHQTEGTQQQDDNISSDGTSTHGNPHEMLMDRSWTHHVDLMADFSTFLQDLEGSQELIQGHLARDPQFERTQSFRLDDLDVEDDLANADDVPLIIDDEDETSFFALTASSGSQPAPLLRATDELSQTAELSTTPEIGAQASYVSPPIPSLNLDSQGPRSPALSAVQVVVDSDLGSGEVSSDATELVTMRHAEAPSARVRRRDSLDQEAVVLKESGKAENRRVMKQAREGIGLFPPKRLGSLFTLEDTDSLTRPEAEAEEIPDYLIKGLASPYDWRAATEIPNLWVLHIKKLTYPLEERFRLMISNALLNKYFEAVAKDRSASDSLYSSDYFNENWRFESPCCGNVVMDAQEATMSRASSDRRSARFGLSASSLTASSSNRIDMETPCLSLDDSLNSAPKACEDLILQAEVQGDSESINSMMATPFGGLDALHIEMSPDELEQSSRTISQAEATYNPLTWQMLCVIRNKLKKRAEVLNQPVDTAFIHFHDLVPPQRCRKSIATQAIYQVLILLTLNELKCSQMGAFGSIRIMLGPGPVGTSSTALASTTGTWSSEDAGILQSIDAPNVNPTAPIMPTPTAAYLALPATSVSRTAIPPPEVPVGEERKRSRQSKMDASDTESGISSSPADENGPPVNRQRTKRRRVHDS